MTTPYMQSRTSEFGAGMNHMTNPGSNNDNSLTEQSSVWNTEVRATIGKPQSVLQPLEPSADGMSSQDAADRTFDGQYLGNTNGESSPSFQTEAELRLEDQQ